MLWSVPSTVVAPLWVTAEAMTGKFWRLFGPEPLGNCAFGTTPRLIVLRKLATALGILAVDVVKKAARRTTWGCRAGQFPYCDCHGSSCR